MKKSQLIQCIKLLTPNQLKEICVYLYIDEYYPLLKDHYLKRYKLFDLEYRHSMSTSKLVKTLKFCRLKIEHALLDDDFLTKFGKFFK